VLVGANEGHFKPRRHSRRCVRARKSRV